jgi:hypothetical protein
VYDPNGPVKVLRVNFHFISKTNGTGNFNETNDGYYNPTPRPYNGYMYADDLIKWCNEHWNENPLLLHMPIPAVPALPKKIQLQLCGVYFHHSDYDYNIYDTNYDFPPYVENSGEVINIYITKGHRTNPNAGGVAQGFCGNSSNIPEKIVMFDAYGKWYKMSVDNNDPWYMIHTCGTVNHEIGHLLNLSHVIQNCWDATLLQCKNNCDDGIDDTPTCNWLVAHGFTTPVCWDCPSRSNNLMDYCTGMKALSPKQIARMHECIDGTKLYYRNCKFKTNSLTINSFTNSKTYIARHITISPAVNIVVENNKSMFLNAEDVTINGPFEVQLGSVFSIETVPACPSN